MHIFGEWKELDPEGCSNPTELLTIERELLGMRHMTLQQALSCIREPDRSRPLNVFTECQIARDIEIIEDIYNK